MNRDKLICDRSKINTHLYKLLKILSKENNKLKNATNVFLHKKHNSVSFTLIIALSLAVARPQRRESTWLGEAWVITVVEVPQKWF